MADVMHWSLYMLSCYQWDEQWPKNDRLFLWIFFVAVITLLVSEITNTRLKI